MPTPTAADIAATIAQTAADGVASATGSDQSTTATPIKDLITAHQFAAAQAASAGTNANGGPRSSWGMTRQARGIPPGAV